MKLHHFKRNLPPKWPLWKRRWIWRTLKSPIWWQSLEQTNKNWVNSSLINKHFYLKSMIWPPNSILRYQPKRRLKNLTGNWSSKSTSWWSSSTQPMAPGKVWNKSWIWLMTRLFRSKKSFMGLKPSKKTCWKNWRNPKMRRRIFLTS